MQEQKLDKSKPMPPKKLYFRHGAVGSAKTLNLLAVAFNYEQHGKKVLTIKPKVDDRFGYDKIQSRAGLSRQADIIVTSASDIPTELKGIDCVLVDEAQFLDSETIDRLRALTYYAPVLCWGLRTNFKTKLFAGSQRLMEVADAIEPVKTICVKCNRHAIFNLRHGPQGQKIIDGPEIDIGSEDKFFSVCYHHYLTWSDIDAQESKKRKKPSDEDEQSEKEQNKKAKTWKYCNRGIQGDRRGCWNKVSGDVDYCEACAKEKEQENQQEKEQQKSSSASGVRVG